MCVDGELGKIIANEEEKLTKQTLNLTVELNS